VLPKLPVRILFDIFSIVLYIDIQ